MRVPGTRARYTAEWSKRTLGDTMSNVPSFEMPSGVVGTLRRVPPKAPTPLPTYSRQPSKRKLHSLPADIRAVMWLANVIVWLANHYPLARSFAAVHMLGPVSPWVHASRRRQCAGCEHMYEHSDGHLYCKGDNGGKGCGCGHWKLSRIWYKLWLAGRQCPQRKFGLGLIAEPVLRLLHAWHRHRSSLEGMH